MKIGIMSDTHGSLLYFEKALNTLSDCDVIIHAGDILYHGPRNDLPKGYDPKKFVSLLNDTKNIIIAKGNCDADVDQMVIDHPIQSNFVISQFGEIRILTNHGYESDKENIIKKAKNMDADILILGHTHIKELYCDDNLIVLNPGSTSIPKDGTHSVAKIEFIKSNNDEIELDINLFDINTNEIIHIN